MLYKLIASTQVILYFVLAPTLMRSIWPIAIENKILFVAVSQQIAHIISYVLVNCYYFIFYNAQSPSFEKYKVEEQPWPWIKNSSNWIELRNKTLIGFCFNVILGLMFSILSSSIRMRVRLDLDSFPSHWEVLWQCVFSMICEDFLFYWCHRLLHSKQLYGIHKQHHTYQVTVSISAEYANPIEYVIGNIVPAAGGYLILGSRMHLATFLIWIGFRIYKTLSAHSGYQFPWEPFLYLQSKQLQIYFYIYYIYYYYYVQYSSVYSLVMYILMKNIRRIKTDFPLDSQEEIEKRLNKFLVRKKVETSESDYHAELLDRLVKKSLLEKQPTLKYLEVCEEFGIDFNKLRSIKTESEREQYVIDCSTKQIESRLEALISKQTEQQSVQVAPHEPKLDLYAWLQIETQYKQLKEILKYALIELVQEPDNQTKVCNYSQKILKMSQFIDKQLTTSTAETYRKTTNSKIKLDIPIQDVELPNLFYEWNQAIEQGFIKSNKNFHKNGQELLKESSRSTKSLRREQLLDRFSEGNYMTPEELKFLSSTSYLINRCCDKQFLQKAIDLLDNSVKEQIELNIAEQVLQSYYYVIKNQKDQRNRWLKQQNIQKRKDIKSKSKILAKQQYQRTNHNIIKIMRRKLLEMLKEIQKRKQLKEAAERKKINALRMLRKQGNPLANIYVQKFKEKVMQFIKNHREYKKSDQEKYQEFLERNQAKPPPNILFTINREPFDAQKSKRMYHPSSKLTTDPREEKKYRLGIRNASIPIEQFKSFYSGGPQSKRQFASMELHFLNDGGPNPKHQWLNSEAEVRAADRIKAAIKRYIQKKGLKKLIQHKEIIKSNEVEMKIQKCLAAKSFFQQLRKELDKQQTESLKNIEQYKPPLLKLESVQVGTSPRIMRHQDKDKDDFIETPRRIMPYSDEPNTIRKVEEQIELISRKKKMQKFSRQKEISEAKLKNRKLIIAAKMQNMQIAIQAGFHYTTLDTRLHDLTGNTPLFYTAKNGDEQFCKFLLNLGADVNQKCSNGNTPLHMAFKSGNSQIVLDFINHKGDLNILNNEDFTPLAFGSQKLLQSLNLVHQIAFVGTKLRRHDNNELLNTKFVPKELQIYSDILEYNKYTNDPVS